MPWRMTAVAAELALDFVMKARTVISLVVLTLATVSAQGVTYHRSFRNGYPAGAQAGTTRAQPQPAVLKPPKVKYDGVKVVTNRVVLTREQAERLLKSKKGLKVVKRPADAAGTK